MDKRNCMPTASELHEIFTYQDGKLFWKKKTAKCVKIGAEAGLKHGKGYLIVPIQYKHYYVHRVVYMMHHDNEPYIIDHIDGNKSNNRIENLRPATRHQNARNSSKQKNNTSGAKNVYWNKGKQKWQVSICVNNKIKHIGTFDDFDKAKQSAYYARIQYHGEYARHC